MEKFKLGHVALYAKNWYKRSDNIWEDLKKCLSGDGYSGEVFSKNDVLQVILNNFEKIPNKHFTLMRYFHEGIKPSQCWKHGYITKDHTWFTGSDKLPEYDIDEAAVRYCLSEFKLLHSKEWKAIRPDFNVLPMADHLTLERVDEFFPVTPKPNEIFGLSPDFYETFFGGKKK